MKFIFEIFPLAAFFITYQREGLMTATMVLMVATAISVAILYAKDKKIPINPLVSAVLVGVFGGLTLALNDDTFIKMKPTILNILFAVILWGGVRMGKLPLKYLMQSALQMTEQGWRSLSLRWAGFFLFLALVNEIVWRTQPEAFWVNFKVFGMLPLTVLFLLSQMPLINKHTIDNPSEN